MDGGLIGRGSEGPRDGGRDVEVEAGKTILITIYEKKVGLLLYLALFLCNFQRFLELM